jgi:glycerol uptake facilitator-like aquaporin
VGAQIVGALIGVVIAHSMFSVPAALSTHIRAGTAQTLSEIIATFGLLIVIRGCQPASIPVAVAAYITSAYWFTSSTSFANPAVTVARAFTNTFTGIRPSDVPMFLVAQGIGAVGARAFSDWLRQ